MDLYESRDAIEYRKAMRSFYGIVFAANLYKRLTNEPKKCIIKADWNEDDHPRDENGRFAGSGGGSSTSDADSGLSATGANKFEKGFSASNGKAHWGGSHDHSEEYKNEGIITTRSEYKARALELVQSPVDDDILGYKTPGGQIVRYDKVHNDFVKGRPSEGIATMFKPKDGEDYFKRRMEKEGGIDHD